MRAAALLSWSALFAVMCDRPGPALGLEAAPLLRIEDGMHSGPVVRLGIGGQALLSAADRTVRMWDPLTLKLRRTLRLPAGAPEEGPVGTLAATPDGHLIAVGTAAAVYLLRAPGGQLVRRLALPAADGIADLALSPDGQRLAVGLHKGGLRVMLAPSGAEVVSAPCAGPVAVDFDRAGRLASGCPSEGLSLYQGAQRLVLAPLPESAAGLALRFSPGGDLLAVAYRGRPLVEVRGGSDLGLRCRPDVSGGSGDLWRLAWSADGEALHGGGTFHTGGRYPIRRWAQRGRGAPRDLVSPNQSITDLAALGGRPAFATAAPSLGLSGADGAMARSQQSGHLDWQDGDLAVDARGPRVRFSRGAARWTFSVGGQRLEETPAATGLSAGFVPLQPAGAGGAPAAAGLPAGVEPPPGARALQMTPDGRLLVAAHADGTVRWYAARSGKELLALFPHRDGKRWIAWTPSGYYNASVGGEDLLGWQAERAEGAADFFPVGLLQEHYLRPDVLRKVLFTLDEGQALEQANAEAGRRDQQVPLRRLLPPVVSILSPAEGALLDQSEVTLRVAVRSPTGENAQVSARVLGARAVLVERQEAAGPAEPEATIHVLRASLPARESTIEVVARTELSRSEPQVLHLRWAGPAAPKHKPDLYALLVGISEYADGQLRLLYPAKDATDIGRVLQRQQGGLYRQVVVQTLTDRQAAQEQVRLGLRRLAGQVAEQDVAVLMLAGHGMNDPRTGRYYFLPHDGDRDDMSRNLGASELQEALRGVRGKVLVLLDTCKAGGAMQGFHETGLGAEITGLVNLLGGPRGRYVIFAATTGGQSALEDRRWRNGAFSKALLEGLSGRADYKLAGFVGVSLLGDYLGSRVSELTGQVQTPTISIPEAVADFPLAQVRVPPYRRWWFWGGVGLAAAAIVTGTLLGTKPWEKQTIIPVP